MLTNMTEIGFIAGTISSILFALSTFPMLLKAARTRDLSSYSKSNIVIANIANVIHWIYILSLPLGPIWLLHSFSSISAAIMLFWLVQYKANNEPVG